MRRRKPGEVAKEAAKGHCFSLGGERKALSWSNLLFGMRAYIQRDHLMVVFLEVVVQWLYAASTARQHSRVQSRHPGRNPKLESPTLSYPAFEPLTERHAFRRACSTKHLRSVDTLGVR